MSREETQEELFDRLLADLEKSPEEIPAAFFAAFKEPLPSLTQEALSFHCKRENIIKVMKSGIFCMGGLKGKPLPGGKSYKIYPLEDLAAFILTATYYITGEIPSGEFLNKLEESFRDPKPFDEAIEQIEKLENIAKIYRSKRHSDKLKQIRIDLENIKLALLDKPIVFPAILKGRPDRIDDLISLFKEHLPLKTPVLTIAKAISDLLKIYDVYIEHTAILRRIERNESEVTT
jgi:hypothetical protein